MKRTTKADFLAILEVPKVRNSFQMIGTHLSLPENKMQVRLEYFSDGPTDCIGFELLSTHSNYKVAIAKKAQYRMWLVNWAKAGGIIRVQLLGQLVSKVESKGPITLADFKKLSRKAGYDPDSRVMVRVWNEWMEPNK